MIDRITSYFWWRGFGIVDIVLGLMMVVGLYRGLRNGLTKEAGLLTEVYAALIVGMEFSRTWSEWLSPKINMPAHLLHGFLFFAICLFTMIPVKFMLQLIGKVVTFQFSPVVGKAGGMVVGMLRYVMLMSMVSLALLLFRSPFIKEAYVERSKTGRFSIVLPQIVHNETIRFFDRLALFSKLG